MRGDAYGYLAVKILRTEYYQSSCTVTINRLDTPLPCGLLQ